MQVSKLEGIGEQDAFTRKMRHELGFIEARKLSDGTYIGLQPLIFTLAICIGVTETSSYQRRYCYEDFADALSNYLNIDRCDIEPRGYVATRPPR